MATSHITSASWGTTNGRDSRWDGPASLIASERVAKDRPEKIEEAFIVIVECARRIQLISWVIQLMVG
jgi:hypothetical protein